MDPADFVKKVVNSYNNSIGVFSNKINAEEHIPFGLDNRDKATFLFYVIQLDYATKSQRLYEGALKLYKDNADFFKPQAILSYEDSILEEILRNYLHPRYINEAIKRYLLNSQKLIEEYDSDPTNIFKNSSTAKEFLKKVRDFRGFGPKIGNFYVRTMINTFNLDFPDTEDILPPVDVHDVRIAHLLGYIDSDIMSQKNINNVKNIWSKACKEAKESWLVFDKALWLLGSEGSPKSKEDILTLLG